MLNSKLEIIIYENLKIVLQVKTLQIPLELQSAKKYFLHRYDIISFLEISIS